MEQTKLFKGELMEELLRNYFLGQGFYVIRGLKLQYENVDLSDIDLFLYKRSSSLTRQRINVDIKNKKSPVAFERIVWANGLMKILNFDACIVATTDTRSLIRAFAERHKTILLDGSFLQKLHSLPPIDRITEEELLHELSVHKSYKTFGMKDWKFIYEQSKSKVLSEQDFSGFNSSLYILQYFITKSVVDEQKKNLSIRMTYIVLSHLLTIIDFIVKDFSYLEPAEREKRLSDGFKFGNLGKDGVDKIISMAVKISGRRSSNEILKELESIPVNILKDFFARNDNIKNLFSLARDFESLGFRKTIIHPNQLDVPLKSVISVMLDFMKIDRIKYFEL